MYLYRILLITSFFGISISAYAQEPARNNPPGNAAVMLNKTEIKWTEQPGGLKTALLTGDPQKEGPFIERIIFPANFSLAPHWHPAYELVSVLEGSFYEGIGNVVDTALAKKINAGGYIVMPAKQVHFAYTKEQCLVQIQGYGPTGRVFVKQQ